MSEDMFGYMHTEASIPKFQPSLCISDAAGPAVRVRVN